MVQGKEQLKFERMKGRHLAPNCALIQSRYGNPNGPLDLTLGGLEKSKS